MARDASWPSSGCSKLPAQRSSQGADMERIWGPVNGFYLAAYAAPVG